MLHPSHVITFAQPCRSILSINEVPWSVVERAGRGLSFARTIVQLQGLGARGIKDRVASDKEGESRSILEEEESQ